jgi:hypothetical protein
MAQYIGTLSVQYHAWWELQTDSNLLHACDNKPMHNQGKLYNLPITWGGGSNAICFYKQL